MAVLGLKNGALGLSGLFGNLKKDAILEKEAKQNLQVKICSKMEKNVLQNEGQNSLHATH